jgi:tetratricopeptide (TPR) repeat protein
LTTDLMSLSRPGDELWKNALVTSIDALARAGRWGELHRHLSLLRANTARYPDQAALNRWLAYRRAMSRVQRYLSQRRPGSTPHGMAVPPFGQAPYATRPLAAEDIAPAWGDYGDGTCEVQHELGELAVLAEGAPLAEVLQKVGDATGLRVQAEGLAEHHVTASLSGVPPRQALELVLGSVGLAPRGEDVVRVVPAEAGGGDGAGERPLWALQEFLILYPESARVPEAYCALGFLQMMHGRTGMGLDQLAVLCREHPRSPWSVYGHYLIGRGACDSRQWEEAKWELLLAVDLGSDHELTQPALIWAAHAQVELGEYDGAARCFRRALAFPSDSPLEPAIMYNIAYCLEKSGAPVLETEQRYRELSTRYAGTAEARKADFRLARIALRAGNYGQAVARYEHFLEKWPPGSELTPQACADLMEAYCRNRNHVRAVMLGEVMCRNFSDSAAFGRALPSIWDACQRSGLESVGLEVIEHCLQGGEAPVSRQRLLVAKIRFQIALGRLEEARKTLEAMGPEGIDPDLRHEARLVESRLAAAEGKPGEALRLRRRVALKCHSDPIRRQAMEMMARDYERKNDFASAALVYGGKVPLAANEGTP